MIKRGSQTRDTLAGAGLTVRDLFKNGDAYLKDESGKVELWHKNDNFAGYVIEINGEGYEFVRTVSVG